MYDEVMLSTRNYCSRNQSALHVSQHRFNVVACLHILHEKVIFSLVFFVTGKMHMKLILLIPYCVFC